MDITSKEPMPYQWFTEELGPDQRVGVWSDIGMSLEALKRLQSLVNSKVTQMSKGAIPPAPAPV